MVEKLLGWHVFWSIGVSYLVNFVFHAFFGGLAAKFIGWQDSPFQFEVATASLGFAAVGFVAAWRSYDLRCSPSAPRLATCIRWSRRTTSLPAMPARSSMPTSLCRCSALPSFGAPAIEPLIDCQVWSKCDTSRPFRVLHVTGMSFDDRVVCSLPRSRVAHKNSRHRP